MRPTEHGEREPRPTADAHDRARPPRTATPPSGAGGRDEPQGDADAVTRARVREAATRTANAAHLYETGRFDEAVRLFEQALASCRALLGDDHLDTLTVAGNLGVAQFAAGNRRKAIRLITDSVASRARVVGADHPITLVARNALAAARRIAGDADDAVELAERVVVQRARVLGAAHVDTLRSRMNLVLALAAAGEVSAAHRALASTLDDADDQLGPDHPVTSALLECAMSHGLLQQQET